MRTRLNTRIPNFLLQAEPLIIFTIRPLIFPTFTYAQDVLWTKINGASEEQADPIGIFGSLLSKNMATAPNNPKVTYTASSKAGGVDKLIDGSSGWIKVSRGTYV
jgi:hypothetical protein